jgi:hypothetical protein
LFPPDKDVAEIYDLKGSTEGRAATPEERQKKMVVLKDLGRSHVYAPVD